MAAKSSPAMIDERTVGILSARNALTNLVVEECPIDPEGVVQTFHILTVHPLLPVQPPKVNSLFLKRMNDGIEVGISPFLLIHTIRNRGKMALFSETPVVPHKRVRLTSVDISLRTVIIVSTGGVVFHESLVAILIRTYS